MKAFKTLHRFNWQKVDTFLENISPILRSILSILYGGLFLPSFVRWVYWFVRSVCHLVRSLCWLFSVIEWILKRVFDQWIHLGNNKIICLVYITSDKTTQRSKSTWYYLKCWHYSLTCWDNIWHFPHNC